MRSHFAFARHGAPLFVALTLAMTPVLPQGAAAQSAQPTMPMQGMQGMPGMSHGSAHGAAPAAADSPATAAFKAASARMHKDMDIDYTGNADVDFVRGMIAHHEGAVAMAKIELAFGKDPEIRKLAEGIVAAQESEIAFMKAWLAKAGAKTGAK